MCFIFKQEELDFKQISLKFIKKYFLICRLLQNSQNYELLSK